METIEVGHKDEWGKNDCDETHSVSGSQQGRAIEISNQQQKAKMYNE
jgi:hypothetical protein